MEAEAHVDARNVVSPGTVLVRVHTSALAPPTHETAAVVAPGGVLNLRWLATVLGISKRTLRLCDASGRPHPDTGKSTAGDALVYARLDGGGADVAGGDRAVIRVRVRDRAGLERRLVQSADTVVRIPKLQTDFGAAGVAAGQTTVRALLQRLHDLTLEQAEPFLVGGDGDEADLAMTQMSKWARVIRVLEVALDLEPGDPAIAFPMDVELDDPSGRCRAEMMDGDTVGEDYDVRLVSAADDGAIAVRFWDHSRPGLVGPAQRVLHLLGAPKDAKHNNVHCDGCEKVIKGTRYSCATCGDVDACLQCLHSAEWPARHAERAAGLLGPDHKFVADEHRIVAHMRSTRPNNRLLFPTSWESMAAAFANGGDAPFLAMFDGPDGEQMRWTSFRALHDLATDLGSGLRRLAPPGALVAIACDPGVEACAADVATIMHTYVTVPVTTTLTQGPLAALFDNAAPSLLLCSPSQARKLVALIPEHLARLDAVVVLPEPTGEHDEAPEPALPTATHTLDEVVAWGRERRYWPARPASSDTLVALCYTSGSTGTAKGATVTEGMLQRDILRGMLSIQPIPYVSLLYMPLTHAMGRDLFHDALVRNGQIGVLFRSDMRHIYRCMRRVGVTRVSGVPALWLRLMSEYTAELDAALAEAPPVPLSVDERALRAERIKKRVRLKYRRALGPRLQKISVGAAKVSNELWRFLTTVFSDIEVHEGYGATEVGAIATNNRLLHFVDWKLEPVPDLGYTSPRVGHLLVKTPDLMPGYYNNPELNAAMYDEDGYFRTGDIVKIDNETNAIKIIDRVGNMTKLSNGEFVSPESLACVYDASPLVVQVYVHASVERPVLAAVVVPVSSDTTPRDVVRDFARLAADNGLPAHEGIGVVVLAPEPFTAANGLLTPSHKVNRRALAERFRDAIDAAFAARTEALVAAAADAIGAAADTLSTSTFAEMGADSMAMVRLAHALSKEAGRKVGVSELVSASTVGEAIEIAQGGNRQAERREAELVAADAALGLGDAGTPGEGDTVLLTGATGLIGAAVLCELLARGERVVCLVRASSNEEARARIGDRAEAIAGDLASDHFGLGPDEYASLVRQTRRVVHCAAAVNWLLGYGQLRAANVLGTWRIAQLAVAAGASLTHVSTVSVGAGPVTVARATAAAVAGHGYASTKAVAELIAERVPGAVIVRPGMIGPHLVEPIWNPDDFVSRFVRSCIRRAVRPGAAGGMHILPADDAARAVLDGTGEAVPEGPFVGFAELGRIVAPEATAVPLSEFSAGIRDGDPLQPLVGYVERLGEGGGDGGEGGEELMERYRERAHAD